SAIGPRIMVKGHAIGLRIFDRCEARFQAQLLRESARLFGGIGAAVAGQHLNPLRRVAIVNVNVT
ncbi:MAG: hypothetical protein AAGA95_16750, partial [Pseudomonadota bacterium]